MPLEYTPRSLSLCWGIQDCSFPSYNDFIRYWYLGIKEWWYHKLSRKDSFVFYFPKSLYRIYLRSYLGLRVPLCGYEFNTVNSIRDIQIFYFFLDPLGEFVSFKQCFVHYCCLSNWYQLPHFIPLWSFWFWKNYNDLFFVSDIVNWFLLLCPFFFFPFLH